MKLLISFASLASATFRESFSHKVERNIAGDWVDSHLAAGRYRRQERVKCVSDGQKIIIVIFDAKGRQPTKKTHKISQKPTNIL